jgi:MoaA/NifB/PqqE/SkfB family radical SAM enzyme
MPVHPTRIALEASSHCQLRCPSCPTTVGAIHPAVGSGYLRFADFQALVDANPQVKDIELSNYGEAFLNPQLGDILRHAFEKDVRLHLANGDNFNHVREEILEALIFYRLRTLRLSIDGASEETYAVYRRGGSFQRVMANLARLVALKRQYESDEPRLTWQFVVFGHNEHEIPAARAMAEELGMEFKVKLSWDDDFSPVRDAEFVRRTAGVPAVTRAEYREKTSRNYMGHSMCRQLWDRPQINWDGKVLGCCRNFWGDFGGNAFRDGLEAAVNHEKMQHARAMLQGKAPPRDDIPCTTCELYLEMREDGRWIERD